MPMILVYMLCDCDTALHWASYWGHADVVKYLVQKGLHVDDIDIGQSVYRACYSNILCIHSIHAAMQICLCMHGVYMVVNICEVPYNHI